MSVLVLTVVLLLGIAAVAAGIHRWACARAGRKATDAHLERRATDAYLDMALADAARDGRRANRSVLSWA